MFSLKSPSLLAFDQGRKDPIISHNLEKLYGIKHAPSDTYMREELDEVDPVLLRDSFTFIFEAAQRGKLLEKYQFLGGLLVAADGTGLFESDNINCDSCCEKHHRDGKITYYHQALAAAIVHPGYKQVIPLCPELIRKQDGATKNDCESRALKRLLKSLKKEHPRLKLTILADALSADAPTINEITQYGYNFIINAKQGKLKSLFEWIKGLDLREIDISVEKNSYHFRYINNIPLNDTPDAPQVNFLECKAIEIKGKKVTETTFSWVTDHVLTNKNVFEIMQGGRTRWKIENETFNTLKNQGYQFEHNFGHGTKYLLSVFASLMMLAFLIDQIQESVCGLFQAAHEKMKTRRALWHKMQCYFNTFLLNSWQEMFTAISQSIAATFTDNTS